MAGPSPYAVRLARKMRDLREEASLTQAQLAKALSKETRVAAATLSSWESTTNPKPPPPTRLRSYALFFCTERSLDGEPHLLPERELTAEERTRFVELESQLLELHSAVRSPAAEEAPGVDRYTWEFPNGERVTIICPEIPETDRPPLASERNPNYGRMYRYADLDALVELFGHVRATNPELGVYHRLPADVVADDLSEHLVLLGGVGWNRVTRRMLKTLSELPVSQSEDQSLTTGEIFQAKTTTGEERKFFPEWARLDAHKEEELVEDVAFLARVPNPFNGNRTLTICNGTHSRGVLGAVRCLTDAVVRDNNERYLASRFGGGSFALLMRVPVMEGEAISPDLENPEMRLFEWAPGDATEGR